MRSAARGGGLQDRAPYVVLLVRGRCRPMVGRTSLCTHLRALRPELLGPASGYDTFVSRYGRPKFGRGGRETIVGPNKRPRLNSSGSWGASRAEHKKMCGGICCRSSSTLPVNVLDLVVPEKMMADWRVSGSLLAADIGNAARRPWRWRDRARTRRPTAA